MRRLALLTPNGWALRAFTDLGTGGGGFGTVLVPVAAMLAFSAVVGRSGRGLRPQDAVDVTVIAIAAGVLQRIRRDRVALFFIVVLPVLLILVIGASSRGFSSFHVAVVDDGAGRTGRELVEALDRSPALNVERLDTVAAARKAVRRSEVATAVVLPKGMDRALRLGRPVRVGVLVDRTSTAQLGARSAVASVLAQHAAVGAGRRLHHREGRWFLRRQHHPGRHLAAARAAVGVRRDTVDAKNDFLPGGFDYSAPTMLVLLVFISGLAGSASPSRRAGSACTTG